MKPVPRHNTSHFAPCASGSAFGFGRALVRPLLLAVATALTASAYAQHTGASVAPAGTQAADVPAAAAVSPVVFSQTAEIEREITDPDGNKRITRVPAVKVPPGDQVIYAARISNNGSQSLTGIRIDTPVPEHTTLVQNSVSGAVAVTYSVDGGNRFAPLAELTVTRDGNIVPATAADVTHLRLQPDQPLPANTTFTADYRVTVD